MNSKKAGKQNSEWSERVVSIERVTKVWVKNEFRAILVVGNEQGKVGVGVGKAGDVITAVRKGVTDGKKYIISVPLTSSSSIPHTTTARFGAAKVFLRPVSTWFRCNCKFHSYRFRTCRNKKYFIKTIRFK